MAHTHTYEGTPDLIINQFSKLPKTRKYKVTVISEDPESTAMPLNMITFGMFPQLQSLTEEDFKSSEWRGESIEL